MNLARNPFRTLALGGFVLAMVLPARADIVYSENVVGYANIFFIPGDQLIGNPLHQEPNQLSNVLPSAPDGTTVSLWDSTAQQYLPSSTFVTGTGWTINYLLEVGAGALLNTPAGYTNTFVGTVLTGPGPDEINPPPPPVLGPGLHLLSSLFPVSNRTFEDIIGRSPVEGEFVRTLNPVTQLYTTTTFTGDAWNNGVPLLQIGQAAFFGLGSAALVPEPTTGCLLMLGTLGLLMRRPKV